MISGDRFRGRKICYYAPVSDRGMLDRVEFYKQDLNTLRELGSEVTVATRWSEIPWDADLYFVWWWTWAFQPLVKAIVRRRPVLITGVLDHRWPFGKYDYYARPFWQKWLLTFALRRATANVFVSQIEYTTVTRDLAARASHYIPLTIDVDEYTSGDVEREDVILTVAWLTKGNATRKCIFEAVRCMQTVHRRNPNVRLVIAGERSTGYPELAALVNELGLSDVVEFPGVISKRAKIELMQRCKIYLQPSLYEGFGLAILEAMSCGAAVVSSPVGAVPEVLGDAGLLADGRSPDALAEAVCRLLNDACLRAELGRRGRQRAEALFPIGRRRRELADLIDALLHCPPGIKALALGGG